jgi:ATP-dependent protease ClpP protease subunit
MNRLEQLFNDNRNAPRRYQISARATGETEIHLYDAIGGGFGIQPAQFVKDLKAIKSSVIHLRVNSPGGEVDAARAIATAIAQHPAKVVAHVDGLAASSASFLILAADEIEMSAGAFIMIHAPWSMTVGNAADHEATVEILGKYRTAMAADYARRTGKDLATVNAWMDAETWFTAEEAVNAGLADRIVDTAKPASNEWNLAAYSNVPVALGGIAHFQKHPEVTMSTSSVLPAPAANERARVSEITRIGTLAQMPAAAIQSAIDQGQTTDAFKDAVIEAKIAVDMATDTRIGHTAAVAVDAREKLRIGISDGLLARATRKTPSEAGRPYAAMSLMDMARTYLRNLGVSDSSLGSDPMKIAGLAMGMGTVSGMHSTSDFPLLLGDTLNRFLLGTYDSHPAVLKAIARKRSAPDFRTIRPSRIGENPQLEEVLEGGEITHGTMGEEQESYQLKTFARIFSITRKAIINDDLGAFDRARNASQAATELEARTLVSLLTSNSGLGPTMSDSVALFNSAHRNLAASGAAIGDNTLSAARLAMRSQTGVDGTTLIDAQPAYLIVPATLETVAQKYLATIQPNAVSSVNPFSNSLQLLVEPRLDAVSLTRWYVAADPGMVAALEYAHLAGAEGPQVETRLGWEVDGLEVKVRLDFGCGAVDWRGIYANAGA